MEAFVNSDLLADLFQILTLGALIGGGAGVVAWIIGILFDIPNHMIYTYDVSDKD